jgi:hypothetical protein
MLINIDSVIPNLALAKIAMYHEGLGDEVIWDMPLIKADKTYVSCVFDYNRHRCGEWEGKAKIGGSGYSLEVKLPPEIDAIKPKINYGFTTRGCIRNCPFCIVPRKEGKIRIEGDIYDIWDGKAKLLTLMDNNILALPEHFKLICGEIKKENLMVDFNQGLDCRLLTEELALCLKSIRLDELRFAFDDISIYPAVERTVALLGKVGLPKARWYVYADENFDSALERLLILKRLGQRTYLMRDRRIYHWPKFIALARWGGHMPMLTKKDFYDFLEYHRGNDIFRNSDEKMFDFSETRAQKLLSLEPEQTFAEKYSLGKSK